MTSHHQIAYIADVLSLAVTTSALLPSAIVSATTYAIQHQRTDPGCPWQNGRIECFFGTLKQKQNLDQWSVDSVEELGNALAYFRFFYNHVRPHQNLSGRTPAEAWAGTDILAGEPKMACWFEAWGGLLQGFHLRR